LGSGINEDILKNIGTHLINYDCNQDELETFIRSVPGSKYRTGIAIKMIDDLMQQHEKRHMSYHLRALSRIEENMKGIAPYLRDHVSHALMTFLLGIYLYENILKENYEVKIDPFQWKLAALFHDVAYVTEVMHKSNLKYFANALNTYKEKYEIDRKSITFKTVPMNLFELQNNINPLSLIGRRLYNWGINLDATALFYNMIDSCDLCHGMLGAVAMLYVIDVLYEKNNPERQDFFTDEPGWSQDNFTNDIIPACTAIFLHNLNPNLFGSDNKISLEAAPLAYLLKLSDSLQEWERPSQDNQQGYSGNLFQLEINGNKVILKAGIPEDRKTRIKNELQACIKEQLVVIR
jgi:hypothetical protein